MSKLESRCPICNWCQGEVSIPVDKFRPSEEGKLGRICKTQHCCCCFIDLTVFFRQFPFRKSNWSARRHPWSTRPNTSHDVTAMCWTLLRRSGTIIIIWLSNTLVLEILGISALASLTNVSYCKCQEVLVRVRFRLKKEGIIIVLYSSISCLLA